MRFAAPSLLLLFALAVALPAREPTKNDLLAAVEKQLQAANEAAGPCVGCVVVSRSEKYPAPPPGVEGALGAFDPAQFRKDNPKASRELVKSLDLSAPESIPDHGFACGVVIDKKGFVLTPYHVIEGATKIYVHLSGGGSYADIHAADARNDLAVLKLATPPRGLKAIEFGDVRLPHRGGRSTVTNGKLVVLVANAYASNVPLDRPTAALGSIANVYPQLEPPASKEQPLKQEWSRPSDSYYYHGPFLAHDAKLNASISGAALLNLNGQMIGLTTTAPILGQGEKTPDYAFPMDEGTRRVIDVLLRGEEVEYGYLGVILVRENAREGRVPPNEVMIGDVIPLGPAAQAGLRPGDVITHVNGVRVRKYEELLPEVGSALAGSKVSLTVASNRNQSAEVLVTLGKLRHGQPSIASVRPEPVFGLRVDHGSILAQPDGAANAQILAEGVPVGVSVHEVVPNSPAAVAFKKIGDEPKRWLVTHVNGTAVANPVEFYAAAKGQKAIRLTVTDATLPSAKRQTREVSFP